MNRRGFIGAILAACSALIVRRNADADVLTSYSEPIIIDQCRHVRVEEVWGKRTKIWGAALYNAASREPIAWMEFAGDELPLVLLDGLEPRTLALQIDQRGNDRAGALLAGTTRARAE